jgi:hypothetical protein
MHQAITTGQHMDGDEKYRDSGAGRTNFGFRKLLSRQVLLCMAYYCTWALYALLLGLSQHV